MTTRTSKRPVRIPSKTVTPQIENKHAHALPNLPAMMVMGAFLVGLGWMAINFGQAAGNLRQIIITTLLLVVALLPTAMGLVAGLFRRVGAVWLTRNGFAGYSDSLDAAAKINLLLLLPENLDTPNLPLRLEQLHQHAVKTIFVSPESPVKATAIAAAIGADNFVAAITPTSLLSVVEESQASGLQLALAATNPAYSLPLQHVDMPMAGCNTSPSLRAIVAVTDTECVVPRLVDLLELGQRWRATRQVIWNIAVIGDVLKWVVVIPALFPILAGLNWHQLTSPLSTVMAALIFSGLTGFVCVPLAFFGAPKFLINCKKPVLVCSFVTGFIGLVTIKTIEMLLVMWGMG